MSINTIISEMTPAFAPKYDATIWNVDYLGLKDFEKLSHSNCYEYAVSGIHQIMDRNIVTNPGEAAGDISLALEGIVKRTNFGPRVAKLAELDGLLPAGNNNPYVMPAEKNEHYLVALYTANDGHDYHWIRQDADGKWSEKVGGKEVQRINTSDNQPSVILHQDPKHPESHYNFVNYFYVPSQGVDIGVDAYVKKLVAQGEFAAAKYANHEYLSHIDMQHSAVIDGYEKSLDAVSHNVLTHDLKEIATIFRTETRENVLKQYPALGIAYQTQDVLFKKIDTEYLSQYPNEFLKSVIHTSIAESIEKGKVLTAETFIKLSNVESKPISLDINL